MEELNCLKQALDRDLTLISKPPSRWMIKTHEDVLDVAIIGAGMAGLTAAFALNLQGIFNVKLFDEMPAYQEGPWINYARMRTLRSQKNLMGPALDIPHLTFQAWYIAQFGEEAWETLYKIPTGQWMDYLNWYRKVLHIPVENESLVTLIEPASECLVLHIKRQNQTQAVKARKVVLATGRGGFGGPVIPAFIQHIPKDYYKHTNESIDFASLIGKRVGIIGTGASAFDAAAVALEHGANHVELLTRRQNLPHVNKAASLCYPGFTQGYFQLSDEARWKFMTHTFESGSLPPFESLERVASYSNFHVRKNIQITQAQIKNGIVELNTNQGLFYYDYVILGTGYAVDGRLRSELRTIIDQILLWGDRPFIQAIKASSKINLFPYLGPSFEFLEKHQGQAPYLKNIYCFNHGAAMSQGLLSSDIPEISAGAERLAQGIVADFFTQDWEGYYKRLKAFKTLEFQEKDYSFFDQ